MRMGAWSMARVLRQRIEYYYYYYRVDQKEVHILMRAMISIVTDLC